MQNQAFRSLRTGARLASMLALASAAVLSATSAVPEEAPEWQVLSDDSSRADLFYLIVQGKNREEGQPVLSDDDAKAFALGKEFAFATDAIYDDILKVSRKDSIFGIDISHYTGKIDFGSLKLQNVHYVYAKATQGTGYKDELFAGYWKDLGSLPPSQKVLRGAYHFLSSSSGGEDQAKSFVRLINESGGSGAEDLPPVLDLEWDIAKGRKTDRWAGQDPDKIIDTALAWLAYVESHSAHKKIPMIYTARSWWRERIGSEAKFAKLARYPIWIADYSNSSRAVEVPAVPNGARHVLWQFTENGKLIGFRQSVDGNIYKGTEADFSRDMQLK